MISISLLGKFSIYHHDKPVTDIDTPRLQSLLAYLVLHREAPQGRAALAFLFWPDTSETQARTNLRNLLYNLRRCLPEVDTYIDTSGQTLQWRSDTEWRLDVLDFGVAIANAEQAYQQGNLNSVRNSLVRATELYNGDLFPSCYEDWIIPLREELHQANINALEKLVGVLEEMRDYQTAIHYAQRLLRQDPLLEATYRNLIRLHALNGDRAGGMRVYHTCATVLQRELDLIPSSSTRQVYEQLLGADAKPLTTGQFKAAFSQVIGRENEWSQMLGAWRTASTGMTPHVVMLCGEAGIGKTRLVEELLRWAALQGISSASTRCYGAEGQLSYAPAITWLRSQPLAPLEDTWLTELVRLLPEILSQRPDLPQPAGLNEDWQRQRLFEALSLAILRIRQPLLLTIDDLQWCDRDTLEWLHFLLRFGQNAQFLILATYRPEEIDESHPLTAFLQALRFEEQVIEVDLPPLDKAATHTLARLVSGAEINPEMAELIYRETEGNPLFVVETVRAGLSIHETRINYEQTQTIPENDNPVEVGLPIKVLAILRTRLAQLSPATRELAGLAATIGREFSFRLLTRVSDCEEITLVRQLDELWQRRIVREHGADAYDFSHDKIREVAYNSMSVARRQLLHRQVAQALERLHKEEIGPVSHQIAAHYERAGLSRKAVPYYLGAAKVARQVYANDEALALLHRGLAVIEDLRAGTDLYEQDNTLRSQLWEGVADILELRAQHEDALCAYRYAQNYALSSDRICQAMLHRKTGVVMREQRHYQEALNACRLAENALGQLADEDNIVWWNEWIDVQVDKIWAHYWLAQWPEMDSLVTKVQPVVQMRGGVYNRMRFLMASCLMHLRRERYTVSDEMMSNACEALRCSVEWGDLKLRAECQFEVGFLNLWKRELKEAEENLCISLELAEQIGAMPQRTLCLTYLTILYRFQSQEKMVQVFIMRAKEAAVLAHMPDYVAAATANQGWLALRRKDLVLAEKLCSEALAIWRASPLVYPFQWLAIWPLVAVAVALGKEVEARTYVLALLEPTQQQMPLILANALQGVVDTGLKGQAPTAFLNFDKTLVLAHEMGYL